MPGPLPKPAARRRRPNAGKGETTLRVIGTPKIPKLPFPVSQPTSAWWRDIWRSEMACEWLPSDLHGLCLLARLVEDYWTAPDASVRAKLATEIRLQRQCFGLAPLDRRRLAWTTERADAPAPRRASSRTPARSQVDPRLKEV